MLRQHRKARGKILTPEITFEEKNPELGLGSFVNVQVCFSPLLIKTAKCSPFPINGFSKFFHCCLIFPTASQAVLSPSKQYWLTRTHRETIESYLIVKCELLL